MTAAKNRTFLFVRHHELTNENVSYFLIKQLKTFIDLKATKKTCPTG